MPRKAKGSDENNKNQDIDSTLAELQKQFGSEAIIRLGDAPLKGIEVIPSGIMGVDIALGRGGIPRGRIIEIFGPESSGKTTLSLHFVAEDQKQGNICAFIDAEHALDVEYAASIGVDTDNLLLSQPDNGEQALEIVDRLVHTGKVSTIVIDSVAALTPQAEIEGEMGDSNIGKQARLMSQALRKITSASEKNNCTVIFINQLREKIGVMFGNPETTTGGRALKFYASIRIDIRSSSPIKGSSGEPVGNEVTAKIVKNKVAPPFKKAKYQTRWDDPKYAKGFSLVESALNANVIESSGAWLKYDGKSYHKDDLIQELISDDQLQEKIRRDTLDTLLGVKASPKVIEVEQDLIIDSNTGEILDDPDDDDSAFDM